MGAPPGSIRFLLERLQGLNLVTLTTASINNTAYRAITLNQSQIYSGHDVDGDEISPGYRLLTYAQSKYSMNPLPQFTRAEFGVPNLILTGAFYKAFKAKEGKPGAILIDSDDSKTEELKRKYGHIMGLSDNNVAIYVKEDFFPEFADGFEAATGLLLR